MRLFLAICIFVRVSFSTLQEHDGLFFDQVAASVGHDWSVDYVKKADFVIGLFHSHCPLSSSPLGPIDDSSLPSQVAVLWTWLHRRPFALISEKGLQFVSSWGATNFCVACVRVARLCIDEAIGVFNDLSIWENGENRLTQMQQNILLRTIPLHIARLRRTTTPQNLESINAVIARLEAVYTKYSS